MKRRDTDERAILYIDLDADAMLEHVNAQANGDVLRNQRVIVNLSVRGPFLRS